MIRFEGRWFVAIAVVCGVSAAREADAQLARGAGAGRGTGAAPASPLGTAPGLYANPYSNPYANPFLNPYIAQYPSTASNAALFFLAAQQATGGIGSGQLSGVRRRGRSRRRRPPLHRGRKRPARWCPAARRATSTGATRGVPRSAATTIARARIFAKMCVDGKTGVFDLRSASLVPILRRVKVESAFGRVPIGPDGTGLCP